jgi:hypothetical protein
MLINYVAGYQVQENEDFDHPLILVRRMPESTLPKSEIKEFAEFLETNKEGVEESTQVRTGLKLNLDFGVPVLERKTGIVWLKFQMDGLEGKRVEGLLAHYYVDGSILQFGAATTVERSAIDWPVLEQIL